MINDPSQNMTNPTLTSNELSHRRAASRRLAWVLGASALLIYLVGMFFVR